MSREGLLPFALLMTLSLVLAGWAQCNSPESSSQRSVGPRKLTEVEPLGVIPPEAEQAVGFRFSLSGLRYEITYSGRGKRTDATGKTLSFSIDPHEENAYLVRIQYSELQKDIIVICAWSDSESGWGSLIRLDGKSMKPKWTLQIPAFNVGQGLIEDGHMYITAMGHVGKVNVTSGAYVWRLDDLYVGCESALTGECGHYNSFEVPKLDGQTVLFTEMTPYPPAKTMRVEKQTGRILGSPR